MRQPSLQQRFLGPVWDDNAQTRLGIQPELRGQKDLNESHRAHNPNAFTMPLVVLVDGDTASSAEILAGALAENGRAHLVGQTTYGKASIQWTVKLELDERMKAGMRITVARYVSPTGQSYSGRGITPHTVVEVNGSMTGEDAVREAGQQRAANVLRMMMMVQ